MRILFSCREPGGVGHCLSMMRELRNITGIETILVASDVAYKMMVAEGETPEKFISTPASLMDNARQLLLRIQPDIVIASHSSNGVGIDESLVATANVPTFVFQDYWGEINLGLGVPATIYFVLDEDAKALTKSRWGLDNTFVVGSPKHTMYQNIDIARLRTQTRSQLNIDNATTIIGFFGQSPSLPGYQKTVHNLVRAINQSQKNVLLVIREHPNYRDHTINNDFIRLVETFDIPYVIKTDEGSVEQWLCCCDIVTTMFSLSGFDHAYLSAYSKKALGYVVYLLTNSLIRNYLKDELMMKALPITKHQIGFNAKSHTELVEILKFKKETLDIYYTASKSLIRNNTHQLIWNEIQRVHHQWKS